ncbi:MAG: cytochrome c family protein, partial [Kiloniellales bacterium]
MKGGILTATLALAFAAALGSGAALAEGDAEAGKKVFKKCKTCHTFDPGKKKIGPHLKGVVGRKAGSVEGYKYSKAFREIDLTWDEANLDKFLTKPKAFVKKTKMSFSGLKKESQRADVIAYL